MDVIMITIFVLICLGFIPMMIRASKLPPRHQLIIWSCKLKAGGQLAQQACNEIDAWQSSGRGSMSQVRPDPVTPKPVVKVPGQGAANRNNA